MRKTYYEVYDVMDALGVGKAKAYNIMKDLNNELKSKGYYIVPGKINKKYFTEKCLYNTEIEEEE